jgi:hypothetical protein
LTNDSTHKRSETFDLANQKKGIKSNVGLKGRLASKLFGIQNASHELYEYGLASPTFAKRPLPAVAEEPAYYVKKDLPLSEHFQKFQKFQEHLKTLKMDYDTEGTCQVCCENRKVDVNETCSDCRVRLSEMKKRFFADNPEDECSSCLMPLHDDATCLHSAESLYRDLTKSAVDGLSLPKF